MDVFESKLIEITSDDEQSRGGSTSIPMDSEHVQPGYQSCNCVVA